MIKIEFICHGNICRSPMAEFVMKKIIKDLGLSDEFNISSAATSQEEIGNGVYPPVKKLLNSYDIDCSEKTARQISQDDIENNDYIIAMEDYNLRNLYYLYPDMDRSKVYKLLDFTDTPGNIDDPWYTGEFDKAFEQILKGCKALIISLAEDNLIKLNKDQKKLLDSALET
ncbi:low molecular weight protein-tyrosine-phosphatase [Succinivibrio dextrinosolvens]|uniref:low molecular weight protein-tyrosine-phosphatase n=1 Tax=Succinivibrio dextrinosolvens TaxID=83771 RepID=UPI00241C460B|nr:low molecular weight protein-tyrosine-phosphatase [Succinivibrio dextrinosolvens]MBE6423020.1 low molecular weight phosphotyrosine protein phosphatase [Succinivibrio dextrinosolvens]